MGDEKQPPFEEADMKIIHRFGTMGLVGFAVGLACIVGLIAINRTFEESASVSYNDALLYRSGYKPPAIIKPVPIGLQKDVECLQKIKLVYGSDFWLDDQDQIIYRVGILDAVWFFEGHLKFRKCRGL